MAVQGIDYEKCVNCGKCYDICPDDVFGMFCGKVYVRDPMGCQSCALCAMVCPSEAGRINAVRPRPLPAGRADLRQ